MKKLSSKGTVNRSIISLAIIILFIFLALGSTSLFGLLGVPIKTTSTFNEETNEYTHYIYGVKDENADTSWLQVINTQKDYYGNWKGRTTVSNFNSSYDKEEGRYYQRRSEETVNYIGGRRDGMSVTKYRSYITYDGDDNYYNETYSIDTVCYDHGKIISCDQLKNALLNNLNINAFETLENSFPWFLGTLNVLGFTNQYVQAYMDTLEVIINAESFGFAEFDSHYDDAVDKLEETPYDSLVQTNKMVTSVYGVELMKDMEFRMAVIDQHRDRSKTTLQLLQSNYPHFLTSFDTDSLVVKDSEWEAFCSKFDSLMNIFSPLDISDPFFVDSVDTRIFNILMFISREESDSTKSAIIKSVLKEVKIKKQKFSLSSLFKEHKNVLVQQQKEGVTPKSLATSILIRMIRKYLIDGDIPRLVVKEAFAKQQSIAQLANVTTKLNGKISENNFEILGNVLTEGGVSVTERGLVWAKYHNPTVDDNRISVGKGIGEFTSPFQITGDSNYYVRAFAENSAGTAYGNSIVLNSNGLVGVDKFISGNFECVIYPNPAKNEVHIEFDNNNTENVSVVIVDLSGRIVFEKQIKDAQTGTNSITVNISGLQNGMYICKINGNGTQLHSEKLFVVH